MAEETKPSGGSSPSPQPNASPSGQGALPLSPNGGAQSTLPPEYAGKSAEEIYSTLSDRYKDYDQIRERASRFDKVKEYGYENPDDVKTLRDWVAQVANATYGGKALIWDSKANQYRVMDMPAAGAAAAAPSEDPFTGWEMLEPRAQSEKLRTLVEQGVMAKVQEIAKQFEQRFQQSFSDLNTRNDMYLSLLEQKLHDPDFDIKAALDFAQKVVSLNTPGRGEELIRYVSEQQRKPRLDKKAQDEAIGKAIAEARAKWESENNAAAAPIMDTPRTWQPRGLRDDGGKLLDKEHENRALLRTFREKGWIRN